MGFGEDLRLFVKDFSIFPTFRHISEICNMIFDFRLSIRNIRRFLSLRQLIAIGLIVHPSLMFVARHDNVIVVRRVS